MRRHALAAALAAALMTAACGQSTSDGTAGAETTAAMPGPGVAAEAAAGQPNSPMAGSVAARAADVALREGRLYAPAGDSAIDYWLEARRDAPEDPAIAGAIAGLLPYLLIACEQAIARHDFPEAHRLLALIAGSDPAAPAMQRLSAAIEAAEADSGRAEAMRLAEIEARRQRLDADARAQAEARAAAQQVATAQAAAREAARATSATSATSNRVDGDAGAAIAQSMPPSPQPPSQAPSRPEPRLVQDVQPQAPQPSPARAVASQPAPTPAPAAPASRPEPPPRPLRQPPPRYPPQALQRRMEGSVQVAFTILPEGGVTDTRVISATPPDIFDRSALAAVANYRFEPGTRRVASEVTVRFSLRQ